MTTTINEVIVTTTFTRPNTNFPWHEQLIPNNHALAALQQEVVSLNWANYVGAKAVQRKYTGNYTFTTKWTWFQESTYNEYMQIPKVLEYQAALAEYYANAGGNVTVDVQILPSEFLNS